MKKTKISHVDALFSNGIYPIEFLFYFKKRLETRKIRSALKNLSSVFWPLMGEYNGGVITSKKYVEEMFFDEQEIEKKFTVPDTDRDKYAFFSQYSLSDLNQLFFLKVFHFRNGSIMIPKMNHLAGDGYSYFFLLSILAQFSSSTIIPFKSFITKYFIKPNHNRIALKDFSFMGIELLPVAQEDNYEIEFEKIDRKELRSVIKEVSSQQKKRISMNDILTAIAFKRILDKQTKFMGETVDLTIPIDIRRHVKEYGVKFFANGIMLHKLTFNRGYVENAIAEELAIQIRKSMPEVSRETYINYLNNLETIILNKDSNKYKPFDPSSGCLITNISRLPVDKLNFGSGIPDLIYPLTVEKNSAGILTDSDNYILRLAY
jgi:hypothetical protein